MMIEKTSAVNQRVVALALLFVTMATVAALALVPYLAVVDRYDRTLEQLADKIKTYRGIVQEGEAGKVQQRALLRVQSSKGYYLGGDTPALAAAELQRRVKQVIEQYGGVVVSSQVLGDKPEKELQQVVLRVSMRAGIEALGSVLHTLEAKSPIMVLENVIIGSRPAVISVRPTAGRSQQEVDVRFDVIGFRMGTSPS